MSHLQLVPKEPPPGIRLEPLTRDLLAIVMDEKQPEDVIQRALTAGRSFAVMDGYTLTVAMGIFEAHFGRWQGWLIRTTFARPRHMTFAVREGRQLFDRWQREDPSCARIEIQIRAAAPWRESFARAMGMTECLGPARKFGADGSDFYLYARVR